VFLGNLLKFTINPIKSSLAILKKCVNACSTGKALREGVEDFEVIKLFL
jgi:hypothetical protein